MKPLVSVIIPAYNAEQFIFDSVISAINQTYNNLEIIVVNDGSTDGTNKILACINDPRLKVLEIENSGQCAAANKGFALSKGKFIKYLDADDILNKDHIAELIAVAGNSNNRLILSKWARFYSNIDNAVFKERPEWRSFNDSMEWFITALSNGPDMLPLWQWLIPRKLIELAGGWDEQLGLGNDFEYSSRLLKYSDGVRFCNKAWVYYRSGLKTNMSSDYSFRTIESVFKSISQSETILLHEKSSNCLKRAFSNKYFAWLIEYYPYLSADQIKAAESKILSLGRPFYEFKWGWKFSLVKRILGWKRARLLQSRYYRLKYA